jgi:hypothetical protein
VDNAWQGIKKHCNIGGVSNADLALDHRASNVKHHVTLNEVKGLSRKNSYRLGLKDLSAMPQDDSLYQV